MLADPEDLTDWKKAIERLTSVELRQTLGKNAQLIFLKSYHQRKKKFLKNFLSSQILKLWIKILKKVSLKDLVFNDSLLFGYQ